MGLCIYGEKWDCIFNSGIRTSFSEIFISISGMSYPSPSSLHFSNSTLIQDCLIKVL